MKQTIITAAVAVLVCSTLLLSPARALTLTPSQRLHVEAALAEVRATASLQGEFRLRPDFTSGTNLEPESQMSRTRESIARSRTALIALADAIGDATLVEPDGTLKAELILIGRALRSPDSETSKLFAKFKDPIEDHLPPTFREQGTWHVLEKQHASELRAAYQPSTETLNALQAGQLEGMRIAWEAALLMPNAVLPNNARQLNPMCAEVGAEIALNTLKHIADPSSVSVLIERIRLDFFVDDVRSDRYGYSKSSPEDLLWTAMQLCTVDSDVSHLDVGLILEGVAIIEEHSPNGQWEEMYRAPLLTKFADGYFRSPDRLQAQPAPPEGAATSSEVQRVLDLTAWKSAMAAYPRENLTPAQAAFLDQCGAVPLPGAE